MSGNKNKKMITIVGFALFFVLAITISYGYMSISIGNSNQTNVNVSSADNLLLTYTDCASTNTSDCADIAASLEPGSSVTKTFEITNSASVDLPYTLYFQELQNSFLNDELVYKIENLDTGEIVVEETPVPYKEQLTTNVVIMNGKISANQTVRYRITIKFLNTDYDQNANLDAKFSIKLAIEEKANIVDLIIASANTGTPDFSQVATTDEGVFAMEDDYGTSYYFRGAVENNYVYFAGFYWRIIRVNGDGSVRMIYDGTQAYANGTSDTGRLALTDVAWNANYNDAKYVGWMFGGADGTASTSKEGAQTNETDSDIKEKVDAWYKTNIVDAGYADAVSDEVFCNDRSITSGTGYGANETIYGADERLISNKTPQFTCTQKNDAFTVSDTTNGNGALTYPVGLITADEISAAGGLEKTANLSYYLYKGSLYWSLSPDCMGPLRGRALVDPDLELGGMASVFFFNSTGYTYYYAVNGSIAVAPVINLSAEYAKTLTGTGTMTDPYTT